ncbi:MAG TPA: hypothetical protein G4N97_03195 [Thermoflexia bacterium]|nr:MAG: hypothetical protein DRI80_08180 [Chloroflexota bacterium]HEY67257.1 hypothetical protein [Thermoflexia bacterium]
MDRTSIVWVIGPQAETLQVSMPSDQQEVTRCFVSLAALPPLAQVHFGEYPDLLVLDVTAEPEAMARIAGHVRKCQLILTIPATRDGSSTSENRLTL